MCSDKCDWPGGDGEDHWCLPYNPLLSLDSKDVCLYFFGSVHSCQACYDHTTNAVSHAMNKSIIRSILAVILTITYHLHILHHPQKDNSLLQQRTSRFFPLLSGQSYHKNKNRFKYIQIYSNHPSSISGGQSILSRKRVGNLIFSWVHWLIVYEEEPAEKVIYVFESFVLCFLHKKTTSNFMNSMKLDYEPVAVSRGYDTCFWAKACDGLYQLIHLCQTHCKQVPDFSRPSRSDKIMWVD